MEINPELVKGLSGAELHVSAIHNPLYSLYLKILVTYLNSLGHRINRDFQVAVKNFSHASQYALWRYATKL